MDKQHDNIDSVSERSDDQLSGETRKRRPYQPPRLVVHGDVRGMTLGGSAGQFDSGDAGAKKPFS